MISRIALSALFTAFAISMASAQTPPVTPPKAATLKDAENFYREKKNVEALEVLEALKAKDNELPPAKVTLSLWLYRDKEYQAARQLLEDAAAATPNHPEVLLLNASFAFGEGRLTDALQSCQTAEQAAASKDWSATQRTRFLRDARMGAAAAYERRGNFPEVIRILTAILNDDAKNGAVRVRRALAYFRAGGVGDRDKALEELKIAYKDDEKTIDPPEITMAALWTARTPGKDEKPKDAAEENYKQAKIFNEKATTIHPNNPKACRAYASFLLDNGDPQTAKPYIDNAAKLDLARPEKALTRETMSLEALYYRHMKEYAKAEEKFEALRKMNENDGFAIANLAIVLAELGASAKPVDKAKLKRAIDLATALVNSTKSAEAYAVLGWCCYLNGSLDDAEKFLAQAMKGQGQIAFDTAYYIAKLLYDREKYEDAEKFLKDIVTARGPFVYRKEAMAFLPQIKQKIPAKKAP